MKRTKMVWVEVGYNEDAGLAMVESKYLMIECGIIGFKKYEHRVKAHLEGVITVRLLSVSNPYS